MKTISTVRKLHIKTHIQCTTNTFKLCASSTVGAAAVGLVFGCVPHKPDASSQPSSSTLNTQSASHHDHRSVSLPLRPQHSHLDRPTSSFEPLQFLQPTDTNVQRPSTSAGVQTIAEHHRTSSSPTPYPGRNDSQKLSALVVRRRRSRIPSAMSVTSQEPTAPSGSSISAHQRLDSGSSVSRPAKLTKRKFSKRSLSGQIETTRTGDLLGVPKDTNQRATSFTYGSALTPQQSNVEQHIILEPPRLPPSDEPLKPYLHTLRDIEAVQGIPSRNTYASQEDVRRIAPRKTCTPILVRPEDVAPRPRRRLQKSRAEKRRSILSFDFSSYFGPNGAAPDTSEPIESKRKSRRFSISDMLSGLVIGKKDSDEPKVQRRRLQRPMSQRITSAPVLSTVYRNGSATDALLTLESRPVTARSTSAMASYGATSSQSAELLSNISIAGQPLATDHTISSKEHIPLTEHVHSSSISSTGLEQPPVRPSRYSITPSDFTSSQIGSDTDHRVFSSGDEDDLRSDTAYDSIRTGMTRVSGTFPGGLFDKDINLDVLQSQSTSLYGTSGADSPTTMRALDDTILEEDENAMTPRRATTSPRENAIESQLSFQTAIPAAGSPSSASRRPLSLGKLKWDSDSEEWSENEENVVTPAANAAPIDLEAFVEWSDEPVSGLDSSVVSSQIQEGLRPPHPYEHRKARQTELTQDSKSSLFDWSEHPPLERGLSDLPPRPKTVHGKKNADGRNSRPNSRRAPSGPHARSQSVPAALNEPLESRAGANSKFGTWGVGTKGATEDWDDDFDFDEPSILPSVSSKHDVQEQRADSGVAIIVPQAIREQQTNVLANIGLLKEWGVLIEELKELRLRATSMGLASEQSRAVFDEVDAMIDLADQEVDEPQFPQVSSAQWPDESEERRSSYAPSIPGPLSEDDVFGPLPSSIPSTAQPSPTRPRKNSEAIARSVIEAVQKRRDLKQQPSIPEVAVPAKSNSKVPFDKGTLRHILPHLQGLVKQMKTILRDADSFGISPRRDTRIMSDPPFSQAFIAPSESPSRRCSPPGDGHSPLREGLTEILSL